MWISFRTVAKFNSFNPNEAVKKKYQVDYLRKLKMRTVYLALILILSPKVNSGFFQSYKKGERNRKDVKAFYKNVSGTSEPVQTMKYVAEPITTPVESTFQGIVFGSGTDLEQHNVMTKDGYILTVFRIPGRSNGEPVLIQHGLLQSSKDWLIPGEGKSLAYILADIGYDVWLGNFRGNTYSRGHRHLSTEDPRFWDFSWEQIGIYDIPAVITYITDLTQQDLFYIGHSMGGTTFSVMAIERPDVAKRVTAAFLLAPGTCGHKITSFLKYLAPHWEAFLNITNSLGLYEFLPHYGILDVFGNTICRIPFLRELCRIPIFLLAGENRDKLDDSLLPDIWRTFPAGTSNKLFTHYLQLKDSKKFRKFDYGPETNLKIYNNLEPPTFDLSRLYVNVTVFWSPNDRMVVPDDITAFYNKIPVIGGLFMVKDTKYNHFDFLWATDAPELIYSKIIERMESYKSKYV